MRLNGYHIAVLIGIVLAGSLVGWVVLKPTSSINASGSTAIHQALPPATHVTTADFGYAVPSAWNELSQSYLNTQTAVSGIGNTSSTGTLATFSVKENDSTPQNQTDMIASTLNVLKPLPNFVLLSSVSATVGGQPAHEFDYQTDTNPKIRQRMYVLTYNNKTFFLLFSTTDPNFASQSQNFNKILASFQLK